MHVGIANLKMCTKAFYGKMHVDKDYHICGATAEDYTTLVNKYRKNLYLSRIKNLRTN